MCRAAAAALPQLSDHDLFHKAGSVGVSYIVTSHRCFFFSCIFSPAALTAASLQMSDRELFDKVVSC
jgi:hypothetical protein